MTDDDDGGESTILELGATFLNAFGDGAGDEWREQVQNHVGPEGEIDYDTLVTAAIAAGEQTSRMRQQSRRTVATTRASGPEQNPPLVDVRDIHAPGGEYAGTRIIVSRPDADAFLAADQESVAIKAGSHGEQVDLPAAAAGITSPPSGEEQSVTEFIAFVDGSVLDPAATAGDDETDQADVEDDSDADE